MKESVPQPTCSACAHFCSEPAALEKHFPGLTALSSAYGSTRGHDGLCLHHDRLQSASGCCRAFSESGAFAVAG